ncbi:MAG: hypothetical protein WCB79_04715 [Halobacteriota archaeon]
MEQEAIDMGTKNSGCYYGVHIGCLNAARDPHCRRCAQRLTNAANYVLYSGVNDTDAWRTWTAPYAGGAAEAREEKMASTHFAGDHDAW